MMNRPNSKKPKVRPPLPKPSKWNCKQYRKKYNAQKYQERKQAIAKPFSYVYWIYNMDKLLIYLSFIYYW